MRVLLCHNFYRTSAPSGEDIAYRNEKQMLVDGGIEVTSYEKYNDEISNLTVLEKIRLGISNSWSHLSYEELREKIRHVKPDVVHFHNTFPQITPSGYAACKDEGVPVVQTLHNYRLLCANALLMRDEYPCELCVTGSVVSALRYKCYRDSLLATTSQVLCITRNRLNGSYFSNVDRYIALTEFAKNKFIQAGFPPENIRIRANFLPNPPELYKGECKSAIFVGRITREKGLLTLLKAWVKIKDVELRVVGNGDLLPECKQYAEENNIAVKFLGYLPREDVLIEVQKAKFMIMPSECYEGFPISLLEAFACGTPILVSDIGGQAQIIEDGKTGKKFKVRDHVDLENKCKELIGNENLIESLRLNARREFEKRYTQTAVLGETLRIYQSVMH